ncbi:MAG TPA: SCO family protein [Longimicrobiaceae bacterium]
MAMKTRSRRWLAMIGILALAVAGAAAMRVRGHADGLPFYTSRDLTPRWISPRSAEYGRIHRIAPFSLVDQDGRTITGRDVEGKVYVASFFFTRCQQLCPILGNGLRRVQTAFAGDSGVAILSHSVTPEIDSVATLKRWAEMRGVRSGKWHLLTGDREQIRRLAEESYFVELRDTTGNTQGTLVYTETLVLVDGRHRIRGVYDGSLPYDVTQLIADIRALRAEERGGGG